MPERSSTKLQFMEDSFSKGMVLKITRQQAALKGGYPKNATGQLSKCHAVEIPH